MIIKLLDEFNDDMLDKIISFYNTPFTGERFIYMNSYGGDHQVMQAIMDIINHNKDITTLVGYNRLSSAAFEMFFKCECKKVLLPGTVGMFHTSVTDISIDERAIPHFPVDVLRHKWVKTYLRQRTIKLLDKLNMTNKEKRKILEKGEDQWFSETRMVEFLNIVSAT